MTIAVAGSERLAHHTAAELRPAPARVIGRLFLPGEELRPGRSRAAAIVERVLALAEAEVEVMAADLVHDFSTRHPNYAQLLAGHAALVSSHIDDATRLSPARTIVLGASFTMEYAVEGAALCNPSAVIAPDQDGLLPGQLRVAVSLRGIGEGHLSSIGFATAVVGPGAEWVFEPRETPLVTGVRRIAGWRREELRAVLTDVGPVTELAHAVLAALPDPFDAEDLGRVLIEAQQNLLPRPGVLATADLLRGLVASAYEAGFPRRDPAQQPDVDARLRGGEQRHRGRPVRSVHRRRRGGAVPRHLHGLRRPAHRAAPADQPRSASRSGPSGSPGRRPATRAWRCFHG